MIAKLKDLITRTFGYSIHSDDYNKQHFALTFSEALEWAACYHAGDFVTICRCRGMKMVAIVGTQS